MFPYAAPQLHAGLRDDCTVAHRLTACDEDNLFLTKGASEGATTRPHIGFKQYYDIPLSTLAFALGTLAFLPRLCCLLLALIVYRPLVTHQASVEWGSLLLILVVSTRLLLGSFATLLGLGIQSGHFLCLGSLREIALL